MGKYWGYKKYKDSGIEWLGEIPEHWEVKRLKQVTKLIDGDRGKNYPSENDFQDEGIPFLSTENIKSNTLDFSPRTKFITLEKFECLSRGKLIQNDLVVTMRGTIGQTALFSKVPYQTAFINAQMIIARPTNIFPEFLKYISMSVLWAKQLDFYSYGTAQQQLSGAILGILRLALPPLDEQKVIARFLDHKTKQIDDLIAKKEALIEKLDEKRTALISHAVTKGLDPNVPMKDSGIEWLGEIPKHWSITRLRFLVSKIEQGWSPSCHNYQAEEDEWGVLKVGCVNGTKFDFNENKLLPYDLEPKIQYEINDGDILMSRANTKELLGSAAIVINPRKKLLLCDKLYRLSAKNTINNKYLVQLLRSSIARFQYERDATGASGSMQNIGQDTIKNLIIQLPSLIEQQEIANFLDRKAVEIDIQKAKIQEAIERLKEYRTALITNAVTGKIDVRQVPLP